MMALNWRPVPTSGGDYFFVSRSLGPPFGAISGIGIWLSLTFAIAFYLCGYDPMHYHVAPGTNVTETMVDERSYDLIIIGAAHEWRIRNVLFGSIPDIVADYAKCSVLMVRRYLTQH